MKLKGTLAAIVVVGVAALGFGLATTLAPRAFAHSSDATTAPEPSTTTPPEPLLPNPSLTPGAYNSKVRQKTIRKTICVRGWTRRVRPPVSYTNALKLNQMAQYGESSSPSGYEEDHLIPLELGGAPRNPKNLWPEPRAQADKSDPLETKLKTRVCRHSITLATARKAIRAFKFAHG